MTPINSIQIPPHMIEVAKRWYGNDLLYAVASTGGLTLGNRRPAGATDEEWYQSLWFDLAADINAAKEGADSLAEYAKRNNDSEWEEITDDSRILAEFAAYASRWADQLEAEYNV